MSGLFESSEGSLCKGVIVAVDPHTASKDWLGELGGIIYVSGEDSCSQSVVSFVGSFYRLIQSLEF